MNNQNFVQRYAFQCCVRIVIGTLVAMGATGCTREARVEDKAAANSVQKTSTEESIRSAAAPLQKKPGSEINAAASKDTWEGVKIPGLRLELVNGSYVQNFQFLPDGHVLAMIGTRDGPQMAPIYSWTINGDALSITSETQAKPILILRDPRTQGNSASVMGGSLRAVSPTGEVYQFKMLRSE